MRWLGLHWDEEFRQSDRLALYETAADKLKASGRLMVSSQIRIEGTAAMFSEELVNFFGTQLELM